MAARVFLAVISAFFLICFALGATGQQAVIEGVVKLDVVRLKSSAVKLLVDGGEKVAFVRANGYFSLRLSPGIHLLQVSAVGAVFPQVRVEVKSSPRGWRFRATVVQDGREEPLSTDSLVISPLGPEAYYQVREPFSVWSLLKSPMGIMVVVMVVSLVVMPQLMDSIDPEEMKAMQEQMRSQPLPTLTNVIAGGGRAAGVTR